MEKDTPEAPTIPKDVKSVHLDEGLAHIREHILEKRAIKKREDEISGDLTREKSFLEEALHDYEPHKVIRQKFEDMLSADDSQKDDLLLRLGEQFLETTEYGKRQEVELFIEEGFPVTWQDPQSGLTALHIVAACRARASLRILLKTGECDFLLRDNHGRLPSEMAYLYGEDVAIARLLGNKERKQAEAQGIKLTRRLHPSS
jgi:ankyrin repeat protein